MQKLSRTEKYKEYRNKLNNSSEREIATKELQELQQKIIFNEKRFGDSSRTETDLNRGRRDTSNFTSSDDYRSSQGQNNDYINDIFNELNRYKKNVSNHEYESRDNRDDYINRIKDIVNRPEPIEEIPQPVEEKPQVQNKEIDIKDRLRDFEKLLIKERIPVQNEPVVKEEPEHTNIPQYSEKHKINSIPQVEKEPVVEESKIEEKHDVESLSEITKEPVIEPQPPIKEETTINTQPIEEKPSPVQKDPFEDELRTKLNLKPEDEEVKPQESIKINTAEFINEKPVVELPKSQLDGIQVKRADIQPTVPQHDHSKEFEEICLNVNSLAEEIDSANSFAKDQYVPPVTAHKPENSFEGIQQNIKKDLIGVENDNKFFSELEKEVKQFNNEEEKQEENKVTVEKPEEKKKVIIKSEISSEMKEEFDNTVSLQVDKLLGEISSSKADNISATDIMKDNDKAKKDINDHPGKTIAFEVKKEEKEEVPNNTIVLSNPSVEDASIRTMSFKTEDLEIEDAGKGNTVLNIILSILIVIAVGALGVIIYFFLITRGII